jgi:hypothetical protein
MVVLSVIGVSRRFLFVVNICAGRLIPTIYAWRYRVERMTDEVDCALRVRIGRCFKDLFPCTQHLKFSRPAH